MERGELGVVSTPIVYFVFDGLIAELKNKRTEAALIRVHKWEMALDLWVFNVKVCDWMYSLLRKNQAVDVITWHPEGFADLVKERLWALDVPVGDVHATEYRFVSHRFATDPEVMCVFDPDPAHRFGYGYKAREFSTSLAGI